MGHAISALLIRRKIDLVAVRELGLVSMELDQGLTIIPLSADLCDRLSDELSAPGSMADRPLFDTKAVHRVAELVAPAARFAIIETDYFGGTGDQAAVVYEAGHAVLPGRSASIGPINDALLALGVVSNGSQDPFDTVGLGRFRRVESLGLDE